MLTDNSYGKSGIRLVKVTRKPNRHELVDLTIAVRLEGEFAAAHVSGDNARVLPTDTMKNTVYALAADHALDSAESFGLHLAAHFLAGGSDVSRVTVTLTEHLWEPLPVRGQPHPHSFRRVGPERRTAAVSAERGQTTVEAGTEGLLLLKSAGSAFSGFRRDPLTTLSETRDRIFATSVAASWRYTETDINYRLLRAAVRETLLETFAEHASESVQHTLNAIGEAVLSRHPEVAKIRLSLPNKHHLPVDLRPFGLQNRNEVFVATEEPYGLIEGTLTRGPKS
jgi:urate oxidase